MSEELTRAEYQAVLRQDFTTFVARCFHELNPQAELAMNWHLEVIAAKLTAVRQGKIRRLIINLPPRHLKSLMASIAFPAWCLGHDPSAQILCVSYAQDLADKLARDCRSIMMSPWYRQIFRTRLAAHRQAVQEFVTTRHGYRLATSIGGVLTGRGADIIMIDDPLKPEEALSKVQRQACNQWFVHTLYSRLNDKRSGAIVIIMQRLHEDDLVGHVLAQEPWEVLSFPAIAEADEAHQVETIWGPRCFRRRQGEALHPDREPLETLERIRRTIGEYNFAGQFQQSPAPLGGGLVKAEWFQRYRETELPERFDRIVQSWDTANKVTELSDFSVCTTWGLKGKHLFLLALFRRRLEYPALKRAVREQQSLFDASVVLIEDKASGTQLIQDLIADGCHGVTRYHPEGEKTMRMHSRTAMIENGFVHIPETAPWLAEYLHELSVFPNGKHDDQADSTAQFLDWCQKPFPGQNIFELYRRDAEAAEQQRKPQPTQTVWAIGSMEWRAEQEKSR
jgi:predicted phage terminase large subunit-like protein